LNSNPFGQPLPKQNVVFKARLWLANESGKDSSAGDLRAVATRDYLWLGRDLSVPLAWIESVESVGPGFRIQWENKLESVREHGVFCVRTMFGYDKTRRDAVVAQLRELASSAASAGAPAQVRQSESELRCQVCAAPGAQQYDFRRILNVLFYWVSRPERVVLCSDHARGRLLRVLLGNSLFGTLGLPGAFFTPYVVFAEGNIGRERGLITTKAILLLTALATLPILALAALVVYAFTDAV